MGNPVSAVLSVQAAPNQISTPGIDDLALLGHPIPILANDQLPADAPADAPVGTLLVNSEGRIVRADLPACRLLGTQKTLLGVNLIAALGRISATPIPHDYPARDGGLDLEIRGEASAPMRWLGLSTHTPDTIGNRLVWIADTSLLHHARFQVQQSHRRYRALLDSAAAGLALAKLDTTLTEVNPVFCGMLGYTEAELLNRQFSTLIHPDSMVQMGPSMERLISRETNQEIEELQFIRKDGSFALLRIHGSLYFTEAADPPLLMAVVEDISEQKKAARELQRQQVEAAAIGSLSKLTLNGALPREITFETFNTLHALLGFDSIARYRLEAKTWMTQDYSSLENDFEQELHMSLIPLVLAAGMPLVVPDTKISTIPEIQTLANHGIKALLVIPLGGNPGSPVSIAFVDYLTPQIFYGDEVRAIFNLSNYAINAIERRQAELTNQHEFLHDRLTGLPNHRLFESRLTAILSTKQHPEPKCLLILNIDDFKRINQGLGREGGDQLLCAFSNRILALLPTGSTLARLSGDEFGIQTPIPAPFDDGTEVAQRLLLALRAPFSLGFGPVSVTSSLGMIPLEPTKRTANEVIGDAATALALAQQQGGDRLVVFDQSLRAQAQLRFSLTNQLITALDQHELEVHYQPIVNLQDELAVGVESLVRWFPPGAKPIPPISFIPLAEESGAIHRLGEFVFRSACEQILVPEAATFKSLQEVGINVSPRQLHDPTFIDRIAKIVQATGANPQRILLELTESLAAEASTLETFHHLKQLGFRLAIDDFGTGQSSISRLRDLPIDYVKIDRSFVISMLSSQRDFEMVKVILAMCQSLGFQTIAEGIESEAEADALRELGCNFGQGYLWSHARPLDQLASWLQNQKPRPNPISI